MAHVYTAIVVWQRDDQLFTDNKYSRGHEWRFDGGAVVRGSSSPTVVPRFSDPSAVDPEEAFIAALSSCHMLFFLGYAAKAGFRVDRYEDAAEGVMGRNADGKVLVNKVTLKPSIIWSGDKKPSAAEITLLHHRSHEDCFIANSVKSEVVIADVPPTFV